MEDKDIPGSDKSKSFLTRLEEGLREYYMFMMLVFSESLGIPNPATYYTMELLPVVYDRFHDWHRRMGMERSPLDHMSCC